MNGNGGQCDFSGLTVKHTYHRNQLVKYLLFLLINKVVNVNEPNGQANKNVFFCVFLSVFELDIILVIADKQIIC